MSTLTDDRVDAALDEALSHTFPASDPIPVTLGRNWVWRPATKESSP